MRALSYSTSEYPFQEIVETYLKHNNLPLIHEEHAFEETLVHGSDQAQGLHRTFYNAMDADANQAFVNLYRSFIKEVIEPLHNHPIIFQRFPTFRVHQPSNIAVFGWHKDKDYNHNPKELNYYLPITNAFDTNTFWYETEPGKADYRAMEAKYGDVVEWVGANCRHGNKTNKTGETRVSFDFRVLSHKIYNDSTPKKSITKMTAFEIGKYYDILT